MELRVGSNIMIFFFLYISASHTTHVVYILCDVYIVSCYYYMYCIRERYYVRFSVLT